MPRRRKPPTLAEVEAAYAALPWIDKFQFCTKLMRDPASPVAQLAAVAVLHETTAREKAEAALRRSKRTFDRDPAEVLRLREVEKLSWSELGRKLKMSMNAARLLYKRIKASQARDAAEVHKVTCRLP
jgi:hypothetical protein